MITKGSSRLLAIVACCLLVSICIFSSSSLASKSKKTYQTEKERVINVCKDENINGSKVKLPEIRLKGNKDSKNIKPIEKMNGYVANDSLDKVNAKALEEELLTYDQFIQKYSEFDFDPSIDADRMVWVNKVQYPKGLTTMRGVISNAVLTVCYDAETGEDLGYFVSSLDKDGMKDIKRPN